MNINVVYAGCKTEDKKILVNNIHYKRSDDGMKCTSQICRQIVSTLSVLHKIYTHIAAICIFKH